MKQFCESSAIFVEKINVWGNLHRACLLSKLNRFLSHFISTLAKVFAKYQHIYYIIAFRIISMIRNLIFNIHKQHHPNNNNNVICQTFTCCGLLLFGDPVFCWLNRITAYSETDYIIERVSGWYLIWKYIFKVSHQRGLRKQKVYRRASKPRQQSVLPLSECWLSPLFVIFVVKVETKTLVICIGDINEDKEQCDKKSYQQEMILAVKMREEHWR